MLSLKYLTRDQRRPWDEVIRSMRDRRAPQIKTEPAKNTSPNTATAATKQVATPSTSPTSPTASTVSAEAATGTRLATAT